jgi:hypothetical protein
MSRENALRLADDELLASLGQLPPDAKFAVVFYNLNATLFADAQGNPGLMPATAENKARTRTRLKAIPALGGTKPVPAIKTALAQRPEVIFFLTDGEELTKEEAMDLATEAGPTRIHTIEFGVGPNVQSQGPLRRLASASGGQYRYIDVTSYRRRDE